MQRPSENVGYNFRNLKLHLGNVHSCCTAGRRRQGSRRSYSNSCTVAPQSFERARKQNFALEQNCTIAHNARFKVHRRQCGFQLNLIIVVVPTRAHSIEPRDGTATLFQLPSAQIYENVRPESSAAICERTGRSSSLSPSEWRWMHSDGMNARDANKRLSKNWCTCSLSTLASISPTTRYALLSAPAIPHPSFRSQAGRREADADRWHSLNFNIGMPSTPTSYFRSTVNLVNAEST